ncbi:MAG: flagellar hook-associated protein FlgL [Pseudomonadota bacterium]
MRISTSTLFTESITSMQQMQSNLAKTNLQMASGQKMLSPADDPAAAARAIELRQSDASNTQLANNRAAASNILQLEDGVLSGAVTVMQDLKALGVEMGGVMTNVTSMKGLATTLRGRLQELQSLANSTDGIGNYLFSGAQGKVQPFATTAAGVVYQGDDVPRQIQVGQSRQMPITDSGADVFMRIRNGNGSFQTTAAAANTGTGLVSQGQVLTAPYNGNSYRISFTSPTTFDITDITAGAPGTAVATAQPYVSGQAITFNGIQLSVSGAPATGDTFDVKPSANQSVFDTLNQFIALADAPPAVGDSVGIAKFQQSLQNVMSSLNAGLNNVLAVRATVGGRLNELDSLQATGDSMGLQFKNSLSKIQDTDYIQAASDFNRQQLALQAAQQSFAKVGQLSLFSYL